MTCGDADLHYGQLVTTIDRECLKVAHSYWHADGTWTGAAQAASSRTSGRAVGESPSSEARAGSVQSGPLIATVVAVLSCCTPHSRQRVALSAPAPLAYLGLQNHKQGPRVAVPLLPHDLAPPRVIDGARPCCVSLTRSDAWRGVRTASVRVHGAQWAECLRLPVGPNRGDGARRGRARAHCERAREHGARILMEPTDFEYGERQYTAEDRTLRDTSGRSQRRSPTLPPRNGAGSPSVPSDLSVSAEQWRRFVPNYPAAGGRSSRLSAGVLHRAGSEGPRSLGRLVGRVPTCPVMARLAAPRLGTRREAGSQSLDDRKPR